MSRTTATQPADPVTARPDRRRTPRHHRVAVQHLLHMVTHAGRGR